MKQGYVAAIDIGTTKIVAIIGKKNPNGQIEVVGLGKTESRGVARGEVINIENTVVSINKAVALAQEAAQVKIDEVYVGIAGKHIRCSQSRGYINRDKYNELITQADVAKLIKDQHNVMTGPGEEIIHVLPQNYLVDHEYDVIDPIGMPGKRLEANFHMVIGKIDSINYIKRSITNAGLKHRGIILEPFASAEAVLDEQEKEVGVILVDIGGGTTDIAVIYENIIRHSAVIPFGGKAITNDIKEGCKILERQAEELKVRHGHAVMGMAGSNKIISVSVGKLREPKEISLKTLAGIIQARMEEIIDAIIFEAEASGVFDKIDGIVITGGGSLLEDLPQLFSFKTGLECRKGSPNEYIISKNDDLNNPLFATSVGLLMMGFKDMETNPNPIHEAVEVIKETPKTEPTETILKIEKPEIQAEKNLTIEDKKQQEKIEKAAKKNLEKNNDKKTGSRPVGLLRDFLSEIFNDSKEVDNTDTKI
ncbi:MAG: cell division protein FtsA [Bacteroidales bacterium]|nr:cell division protein FtsA [Bacteroidales bacterium]